MGYTPSKYQKAIFEWIKNGKGNAVVQAVAGSGKTTTIVQATKLIPQTDKAIFVAFNKAIASELKNKLPQTVEARTLHSLGLSFFYKNCDNRPEVKFDKRDTILEPLLEEANIPEYDRPKYYTPLKKLISLCKNTMIDYKNLEEVLEIVEKYNIDLQVDDIVMTLLNKFMIRTQETVGIIDFDDMIYIPIIKNWQGPIYDWVFVDESQDLNKSQFELIKRVCGKYTRIVAVGDRRQSIYAFRGADTNSMDRFIDEFEAVELPLSICYRCPKKVVEVAKEFVPEIETFDSAPEGTVDDIEFEKFVSQVKDSDLILCRTNAPIVRVAFSLIRQGIKAVVRGRDIGKGLKKLIKKYDVDNLEELHTCLYNYMRTEEEKLMLIDRGKFDKKKKGMIMNTIDSIETLFILMEDCNTVEQVENKIDTIFSDEAEGVVCSSVHKAKGLEADNVYIVNYENMPHPMAKTEEEIAQENNIIYVALTRAKQRLYFIQNEV